MDNLAGAAARFNAAPTTGSMSLLAYMAGERRIR